MKRPIWLVWLLLSLMVALTPMAWASPPDPIWITGIYDDLDFDDGVVYLTCGMVGIPALPVVVQFAFLTYVPADPAPSQRLEVYSLSSHPPRAPPLA
jgi:hypothetical protein